MNEAPKKRGKLADIGKNHYIWHCFNKKLADKWNIFQSVNLQKSAV
jgi:hypothetical protein